MYLEKKSKNQLQPSRTSGARIALYVGGGVAVAVVGVIAVKMVIALVLSMFWYIAIIAGLVAIGYVVAKKRKR